MPWAWNQLETGSVPWELSARPYAATLDHSLGLDALNLARGWIAKAHLQQQSLTLLVEQVALLPHEAIRSRFALRPLAQSLRQGLERPEAFLFGAGHVRHDEHQVNQPAECSDDDHEDDERHGGRMFAPRPAAVQADASCV